MRVQTVGVMEISKTWENLQKVTQPSYLVFGVTYKHERTHDGKAAHKRERPVWFNCYPLGVSSSHTHATLNPYVSLTFPTNIMATAKHGK